MKFPSFGFLKQKIKLKKTYFSDSRNRERLSAHYFNRASFGLTAYGKVLVDLFFTPIVAASTILAGDLFLMIANVLLALGYLSNFVHRVFNKEVSLFEGCLTAVGLAISIGLAIYIAPAIFVVTLTAPVIFTYCSVIATAINSFFLLKNVIVPPLKRLVEFVLLHCFDYDIRDDYYYQKPLELKNDGFVIRRLLNREDLGPDEPLSACEQNKLVLHNTTLKMLCWYINKYHEKIFGTILCEDKITEIEAEIRYLTVDGSSEFPIDFLDKKRSFKQSKLTKIKDALAKVTRASDQKTLDAYNQFGLRFFDNYSVVDQSDFAASFNTTSKLLQAEINRQEVKIKQLEACCP